MDKTIDLNKSFNLAVECQQKNNLLHAKVLYYEILKVLPNHLPSLKNLTILHLNLKEYQYAKDCFEKIIENDPSNVESHNNLGLVYRSLGDFEKAISCCEKAVEINPNYEEAHNNLGVLFRELGESSKARDCYEKAIKINPNNAAANNNLGVIFKELGEYKKAMNYCNKAIEINPNYAAAYGNLGLVFGELGEFKKAKSSFEKAIEIEPNYIEAYNYLGTVERDFGELEKARECFEKIIELDPSNPVYYSNLSSVLISKFDNFDKAINTSHKSLLLKNKQFKLFKNSIQTFRFKHDVEQAEYLISKEYKIDGINQFQKVGNEILSRIENKEDENILLKEYELNALLPFYKSHYIYQPKKITGSCINPNKNWLDVEDEYFSSEKKQIIYIDNFLSDEALDELRKFCLLSKVWNLQYINKYLGSFSENGFISHLHLQIAKDLKLKLPKLFGPHNIEKFWGFKYDTTLGKGINIHADFAIHNLNFWITPDEYNNDKNSGGLKVYDVPAPENWTFREYNSGKKDMIYKYLNDNKAKCVNIPYKFNRAVLFNSGYFHETDKINFKDQYVGRRINNTYLFGRRRINH